MSQSHTYGHPHKRKMLAQAALAAFLTILLFGLPSVSRAAEGGKEFTLRDYEQWMQKYASAKPNFKPGEVLSAKDMERMRPFVPPGYLERLNFPEFHAPIIATRSHRPSQEYLDCSEKYGTQVRLSADGLVENYTCGQPFADAQLSVSDPQSGLKAIWNYEYRWQNFGFALESAFAVWDSFGGNHEGVKLIPQLPPPAWREGVPWPALSPPTWLLMNGAAVLSSARSNGTINGLTSPISRKCRLMS